MASLQGRHALVTGGGRGIGRATAAALSATGARVTALGRNEPVLKEMLRDGTIECYAVADVTDETRDGQGICPRRRLSRSYYILVANAGGAESAPFSRTTAN